jgi:PTS system nitrogen regulatory IIA component
MGSDMMDVEQLAAYLRRDAREVGKLANRGRLPGHKVGGEWRFAKAEINQWLEGQLPGYTDKELTALEAGGRGSEVGEPLLANLLSPACVAVPLAASTKASVLKELVTLAEQSWQVYDPAEVLEAVKRREETATTALPSGVAFPHPRRPLATALGESLVAFARTGTGIPFGAPRGGEADCFFLICCRDDQTHLRVLARLTRLVLRPGFLDALRAADTPTEAWETIVAAERDLLASV